MERQESRDRKDSLTASFSLLYLVILYSDDDFDMSRYSSSGYSSAEVSYTPFCLPCLSDDGKEIAFQRGAGQSIYNKGIVERHSSSCTIIVFLLLS